ncbi:VOC family protein [Leucobacter iarius]|uniref:VOC family protein n=1 Tax=Leucobacter iarius TaxID=333963 RepID=A0ABP4XQB5_9MICO
MTSPAPYLLLPGTAAEALEFYRATFGGVVTAHTFAEFGRFGGPGDSIAHGILTGPVSLFAADAGPDEDAVAMAGMFLSLLGRADPDTLHAWFDALAEHGRVLDPLIERSWGAHDGQVMDRFGVRWLIGYEPDGPETE